MREIAINTLHDKLSYNPETGDLTWRNTTRWTKKGKIAGTNCLGYIKISIDKVIIPAHRIIWAMVYNSWPFGEIDHINGNRSDNRIENLREVTRQQNCMNRSKAINNKSGYKGVSWHSEGNKWQAHISVAGKSIYLGLYKTAKDAHDAYEAAAIETFGLFARHI